VGFLGKPRRRLGRRSRLYELLLAPLTPRERLAASFALLALFLLILIPGVGANTGSGAIMAVPAGSCQADGDWLRPELAAGHPETDRREAVLSTEASGALTCADFDSAGKNRDSEQLIILARLAPTMPDDRGGELDAPQTAPQKLSERPLAVPANRLNSDFASHLDDFLLVSISYDEGLNWRPLHVLTSGQLAANSTHSITLPSIVGDNYDRISVRLELLGRQPAGFLTVDGVLMTYVKRVGQDIGLKLQDRLGRPLDSDTPALMPDKTITAIVSTRQPGTGIAQGLAKRVGSFVGRQPQEITAQFTARLTALSGNEFFEITGVRASWLGTTLGNEAEWRLEMDIPPNILSGTYRLEVYTANEYGSQSISQDFLWGVLALNTDKTVYQTGQSAAIAMTVLNHEGKTVCNADVELVVARDGKEVGSYRTDDNTVQIGPLCYQYGSHIEPDYKASHMFLEAGQYTLTLKAVTANGEYQITDSVEVNDRPSVSVSRTGPTRIYPLADYDMLIDVAPADNFSGVVREYVPAVFEITEASSSGLPYNRVFEDDGFWRLEWDLDVPAGESARLGYRFDAPNLSPEFYLLGPLELEQSGSSLFREVRQWQIASDGTLLNMYVAGNDQDNQGDGDESTVAVNQASSICNTVICADSIDYDADSTSNDADWVSNGQSETTTTQGFQLNDMPADFVTMDTGLNIKVRYNKFDDDNGNDVVTLSAQIVRADGTTELAGNSAPETIETHDMGGGTCGTGGCGWTTDAAFTFTSVDTTADKSVWDGAELELTWTYNKTGPPDNTEIRISAVELNGAYTQATGTNQEHFRWRDDSATVDVDDGWLTVNEDSNDIGDIAKGTDMRLRFETARTGASDPARTYRLEWTAKGAGSCDSGDESWTRMDTASDAFAMIDATNLTNGTAIAVSYLPPEKTTFVNGESVDSGSSGDDTADAITLADDEYTEVEFAFEPTTDAENGTTYCFRVTDAGTALSSYNAYPELTTPPPSPMEVTQEAYIFENDDGANVNSNSNQTATASTAITGVKKGERITARFHVKNTSGAPGQAADFGLFYDRNDGIWTKVEQNMPPETAAGNCDSDTDWNCLAVDVTDDVGSYTSMAIAPDGRPWVSYYRGFVDAGCSTSGECALWVAQYVGSGGSGCGGGSSDWSCSKVDDFNSGRDVGKWSSLAFDASGTPWISYMNDIGNKQLYVASYVGSGGNCDTYAANSSGSDAWRCEAVDAGEGIGDVGDYTAIAFDASNQAVVSYYDPINTRLKVAMRDGGTICDSISGDANWSCEIVDNTGSDAVGERTSVAVDGNDVIWVSYYDGGTETALKVASRNGGGSGSCTDTDWNCETVDNTGTDTGSYTSIAIAPNGIPWVSYYDTTNTGLRVAHREGSGFGSACTDADWRCGAVDSTGSVGSHSSIAFAPDGNAWISYYDDDATLTNRALKYTRHTGSGGSGCADAAWDGCGKIDSASTQTIGQYTSIAFAPEGTAWISYYHAASGDLRVANLNRAGEITISSGLAGDNGDALTASDADDGAGGTDCASATTFVNGKWFEAEEGEHAVDNDNCTEIAFVIGTSQAQANTTYRLILATKDNWRSDKGAFRGPIAISQYATLTIEADTTKRYSKDNTPKFGDCSAFQEVNGSTDWGCLEIIDGDHTDDSSYTSLAFDASGNPWIATRDVDTGESDEINLIVATYVGSGGNCDGFNEAGGSDAWQCTEVIDGDSTNDFQYTSLAFDPSGNPWIATRDNDTGEANNRNLIVATYVGSGGNCDGFNEAGGSDAWQCTEVIDGDSTLDFAYTSLAFDASGNPWIATMDDDVPEVVDKNLIVATYVGSGGNCDGFNEAGGSDAWQCTEVIDGDNATGSMLYTSLAFDPSGNPWIATTVSDSGESFDRNLIVATYVGSGGSCDGFLDPGGSDAWQCTEVIDGDHTDDFSATSLAFDASGNPWIATRDIDTGETNEINLIVATYVGSGGSCEGFNEAGGSAAWQCTEVIDGDSTTDFGFLSLAFDPLGNPWIAIQDVDNAENESNLSVARYVGSGGSCDGFNEAGGSDAWQCTEIIDGDILGDSPYLSLAFDPSGNPWISTRDNDTGEANDRNLIVAKLHLPPTQPSYAVQIPYATRSAGSGDARYRLDNGDSPRGAAPCAGTADAEGYCGASADDTDYDAVTTTVVGAGTSQRPLFVFAEKNTNNTDDIAPTYRFRTETGNDPADLSITLEIYRAGTTNAWEPVQTDSTTSDCNTTDCTLSGTVSTNLSQYYHDQDGTDYWTYYRVWQTDGSAAQTLKTDQFSVTFTGGSNNPPDSPTSLAQTKTDDTSISVGGWTDEDSVKFTALAGDPDASDTLQLCIEIDTLGTGFSNTEDSCGSGVAFSGSPVTVSHTVSGLSEGQYHWQARVKDAGGEYSAWVSFGANAESERDVGIDTSPPTGAVYDGTTTGVDIDFNDGTLNALSANWDIDSAISGLDGYEYSIGTTAGATDVVGWTNNGTTDSATAGSLTLNTSQPYFFNVRTTDNAGNVAVVSSDGLFVAPTLSFSVSPDAITFDSLNAGNGYTDSKSATLTTSTNAYAGYEVRAYLTQLPTSVTSDTVGLFDGGSYAVPDEWLGGDTGYGYTSNDSTIGGANLFGSTPCGGGGNPPCWAPFSLVAPGDVIADHTDPITGTAVTDENFIVTHRVTVDTSQPAGQYTTTVIYTVTATF